MYKALYRQTLRLSFKFMRKSKFRSETDILLDIFSTPIGKSRVLDIKQKAERERADNSESYNSDKMFESLVSELSGSHHSPLLQEGPALPVMERAPVKRIRTRLVDLHYLSIEGATTIVRRTLLGMDRSKPFVIKFVTGVGKRSEFDGGALGMAVEKEVQRLSQYELGFKTVLSDVNHGHILVLAQALTKQDEL